MVGARRSRSLGQNFLVDRNILGVIERLAELGPGDVVLEIGGGEGVLSERLAAVAISSDAWRLVPTKSTRPPLATVSETAFNA